MIELKPQCKHVKITSTKGTLFCTRPEGHGGEHVDATHEEIWED